MFVQQDSRNNFRREHYKVVKECIK